VEDEMLKDRIPKIVEVLEVEKEECIY